MSSKGKMIEKPVRKQMQQLLDTLVRNGDERGLQLAVYHHGELVVDAWAGTADSATGRAVTPETLFPIFSAGKAIAATLAHLLVQRGQVSYDTRIASLWPEFAAHGKQDITLGHALSHTAGLPFMPMGIACREIVDWQTMCDAIAQLSPIAPAGQRQIYHAVTYSWLVGEVIRRVTGCPFSQVLQEEICRPLHLSSMFIGMPPELEDRVAVLEESFAPDKEPSADDSRPQAIPGWMWPLHDWANRPDIRHACIPASNGVMSARSMARHYAALVPGGVNGIELLPPSRIHQATQQRTPTSPAPEDSAMGMSLGYFLGGPDCEMGSRITAFGHGGYGGSTGFADPEQRLAVGFTKNRFADNGTVRKVLCQVRDALGIPQ